MGPKSKEDFSRFKLWFEVGGDFFIPPTNAKFHNL